MNLVTSNALDTQFEFGTKAETLERIAPLLNGVQCVDLYYFSVRQWKSSRTEVIVAIQEKFSDQELVVRSSAQGEDSHEASMAGAYKSVLHVRCVHTAELIAAITEVIDSYNGNEDDQVLVQPMISGTCISGVIMTRNVEDGAPYYVINYDDFSGKTDSVTGGVGVHKTVLVNHQCGKQHFDSERLQSMIRLTQEVERVCGDIPLDIEFGMTDDLKPYLFQVRPISLWKNWSENVYDRVQMMIPEVEDDIKKHCQRRKGILGERTILGIMPDWNPAEMIGLLPDPLAASLYRRLITKSVWREARESMGYRQFTAELMCFICGRPYIDVRNSFNSLLPDSVPETISEKIVNAWLQRLDQHPEYHDKVEFDVAQTCVDFTFDDNFKQRYASVLSEEEFSKYKADLLMLTNSAVRLTPDNTLVQALEKINQLATNQKQSRQLSIAELLGECKTFGTMPFSIIARHAFIAEQILRSAVMMKIITEERLQAFKKSMHTITRIMATDMQTVISGKHTGEEFLRIYGHLRPGTYDIQSLSYKDRASLLDEKLELPDLIAEHTFELTGSERNRLNNALKQIHLDIDADELLAYARKAIEGREYAKFVFTRNVSDVLERLVEWGKNHQLSREDLAQLSIDELLNAMNSKERHFDFETRRADVQEQKRLHQHIKLSYIIRGVRDIYVVPLHRSSPNFIGNCRVEGDLICLDAHSQAELQIKDKIVCIENADPGFDWIFTKGITALITKYGGANSHMAIRCAEFGLPAAIGCGEELYQRLVDARRLELNSADKTLRPIGVDA